jgi:phosphopantothenoylcysteine decarboxylase/phosphopantothenate--cysteine ligase
MEHPPFCVGFAAETQNIEEYARQKLVAKKLKVIAANHVGIEGQGFNSDDNALIVLSGSRRYEIAKASKSKVANDLMRLIADEYLAGSAKIKNKM